MRTTLRRAMATGAAAFAVAVPTVVLSGGSAQAATSYYSVASRGGNCIGYLNFDRRGGGSNWAQGAVYMLSSDGDLACDMVLQRSTDGGDSATTGWYWDGAGYLARTCVNEYHYPAGWLGRVCTSAH